MTKSVLQICPSCAESNGATWKNPRNTAPLFLGVCGCCGDITACTHINFWLGIKSDSELKNPKEKKTTKADKADKSAKPSSSLLGGEEQK